MTSWARSSDEDSLKTSLGVSVALHLVFILSFFVQRLFFPAQPLTHKASVRVDLVGLPDKVFELPPKPADQNVPQTLPEKLPAEPEPVKAPEPVREAVPVKPKPREVKEVLPKKTFDRKRQQDILNRLKQEEALERIKAAVQKEESKPQPRPAAPVLKGQQITSGSQLTGLNKLQADQYIGLVEGHVRQNWQLPQWLATRDLTAQVLVRFDQRGMLTQIQIKKTSGNRQFDEIVIETVRKSAPLPAPPEKFVSLMNSEGILLGFPE